ncbi:ATP-binding protein [Methylobacterium sp. CM6244]
MALHDLDGERDEAPSPPIDLRSALDASALPTLLIDQSKTTIVAANPAFARLTGHDTGDLVGRDAHLLLGANTDNDARAAFAAALAGKRPEGIEVLAWRRNGSTFWAEIFAARLPDTDLLLVQVIDVSRRRDAEGALALSRQREALGLLTNSVAHEFNNFLQILIGYIDGLKRRLGDREEPFIQRAVIRSTDAVERATILTRQLLTFSRRIAPDVRPVDMNALITAFAARMQATLPPGVALTIRAAPDLPNGLTNPTQVDLALSHIVANACEAMPSGGSIEIASFVVPPSDPAIRRPGDGAVGLSVRDTGHGMTPEMAARALAPFITTREAGRGAGLAIVHGLVKRQNGTVSLDSKPGEGTTVRMIFPAAL